MMTFFLEISFNSHAIIGFKRHERVFIKKKGKKAVSPFLNSLPPYYRLLHCYDYTRVRYQVIIARGLLPFNHIRPSANAHFFQIVSKKENGDGSEFNCVGKISVYAPRDFKLLLAADDETKIRTYYRTSSVRL